MRQQISLQLRIYEIEHPELDDMPEAERAAILQDFNNQLIQESGLNLPFLPRH